MQTTDAGEFDCHCGKRFTRIENLRRHQRLHLGTSTRVCDFCGRSFSRNDVLQRHIKTHVGHRVDGGSGPMSPGASGGVEGADLPAPSNPLVQTGQPPTTQSVGAVQNAFAAQQDEALQLFNGLLASTQPLSTIDQALQAHPNNPFAELPSNAPNMPWDDGMLWSLQDAPLQDFDWAMFGISPRDNAPGRHSPALVTVPSRAATPPIDQAEEDKWPTNYQPKRPFVVGTSGHLDEVQADPAEDPRLQRWSRFWLDREGYDRVITSLASALRLPNSQAFRMPSSLFTVNTLISHYFDKFLPQLPILHVPTFQMASAPPLLIASFMMIGACLSSIQGARPFAVDLIEIIRRTQSNLFEMDSLNLRNVDFLHVSLLTSFAGLWSGHQRSFELAELSRGMLINLCRRTRLLECNNVPGAFREEPSSERWHRWVLAESRKRLGLAIFLFDSLFPAFLDLPSYLSQGEMINTILPSDDRFWLAGSAQAWHAQLGVAPIPPAPYFALAVAGLLVPKYATDAPAPVQNLNPLASLCILNALYHHIWEFRSQLSVYQSLGMSVPFGESDHRQFPREIENGFEGRKVWLEEALAKWEHEYYDQSDNPLSQGGRALYHLAIIALNANLRDLYAVSGKFGPHQMASALPLLKHWTSSELSVRAASHAVRLLKAIEFPTHTPSIYAPISAFVAVLTLWAYTSGETAAETVEHQVERLASEDRDDLFRLFPSHLPEGVIKSGVRYLGGCKEWRIGAALALVLAKMIEPDRPV